MNIKITEHPKLVRTVFARDLHKFLGIKTKYADWISRMMDYGFIEDVDYVKGVMFNAKEVFLNFGKNPNIYHGRPPQEYHLTIDAAKEISMLQRTEKGKEARRYFIECERKLKDKTPTALPNFSNPYEAALAWAEAYKQKEIAQAERDEAIRTKAWIGNKREATAMATASTEKRRADKLEDELGKGKNFKTVAM